MDAIYHMTSNGKKWKKGCEYAHHVAYDLIKKRREELVRYISCIRYRLVFTLSVSHAFHYDLLSNVERC